MDVKKKQTPAEDFKLISCLCSHVCLFFLCLSYLVCLCTVCQATAYFWRKRSNSWSSPWQVTVRTLVRSMLRIPRIDFASIKILLYEISTSKSHLLAALTNYLTSSVAFNLIFLDINIILSFISAKNRPFFGLAVFLYIPDQRPFSSGCPTLCLILSDLSSWCFLSFLRVFL